MSVTHVDLSDPEFTQWIAEKYATEADRNRFGPFLETEIERLRIEADYESWLTTIFPNHAKESLADHHHAFWRWIDGTKPDVRPEAFVAIWNRGGAKSSSAELGAVNLGARRKRKYALYVCRIQDQADDHVENIGSMLESPTVEKFYPELSDRMVGKFGNSRGWRRNRMRTKSGFTVDALGLDTAKRGAKLEDQRPDIIILDDIDDSEDSPKVTRKLIRLITKGILPAGAENVAVMFVQNLIHSNGVAARMVSGEADYLRRRVLSGPIPALHEFAYEQNRDGTYSITSGTPTWAGYSVERCEADLNEFGPKAFREECQHEVQRVEGAFWLREQIDANRVAEHPELVRVVVGVDPSGGDNEGNDEQGIVVAGLGVDGIAYVLADITCKLKPHGWGARAVSAYYSHFADKIVGERNFGGDMVEATVRAVDFGVNYDDVTASRGKQQRFEPVAALYGDPDRPDEWHQSRVRHVGAFPELEEEQRTWHRDAGWSPNRLDALAWCLHELFALDQPPPKRRPRAVYRGG